MARVTKSLFGSSGCIFCLFSGLFFAFESPIVGIIFFVLGNLLFFLAVHGDANGTI